LRLAYRYEDFGSLMATAEKVAVMQEGSEDEAERREMIEQIAARLKAEYDLKD
jgi:hypothetical protein